MANRSKTISDNIGSRIKTFRKQAGLTQKELSEKLYKSESTVRMWELGKSEPDIGTIVKLSEILNVAVEVLLNVDKNNLSDPDKVLLGAVNYFVEHPEDPREKKKQELYALMDQLDEDQLQQINDYIEFLANKKK